MPCKISVIMPVYNAERYVKKAIDSILMQTFRDFELIIVEDGSDDNSFNIIKEYRDERIRVFQNSQNKGVVYSRNLGIQKAVGSYIALMDADDIAPDDRLEKSYHFLEQHSEYACVYGRIIYIDENDSLLKYRDTPAPLFNSKYIQAALLFYNPIANGSTMFRKDVIEKYDIQYRDIKCGIEDYMFWAEYSTHAPITGIDEVLQYYRINPAGLTRSNENNKRDVEMDKVHKRLFTIYGFDFSDEERNLLFRLFRETGQLKSNEELQLFYGALKSMISQAEDRKLGFVEELKTACRKMYARKIGKAFFLWE